MTVVETAREMVRQASITGDEHDLAHALHDRLAKTAPEVELQPVEGYGPNVVARSPGDGPTILLNGHLDTVPVQGAWTTNPFEGEIDGGRLYGLGACDMKGGDACIVEAFEAVHDEVDLDLWLVLTTDEEGHCQGAYRFFEAFQPDADLVIIPEATDEDVTLGARGRIAFEITVRGTGGHGAHPGDNVNAIDEAAEVIVALDDLPLADHPTLPPATAAALAIEGGNYSLSVPDACTIVLDRHLVPPETRDSATGDLRKLLDGLDLAVGADLDLVDRPTPFLEPYELTGNEPLVSDLLAFHTEHLHAEPEIDHAKSVGDFNVFAQHAPTVVYGPEGGNLHKGDEWVSTDSLYRVEGFLEAFLEHVGGERSGRA